MSELNLCEILKGYEGETFYSPIFGNLTFVCTIYPDVRFKTSTGDIWDINPNGKLYNNSDELCVFPSKDQRDWNKWVEEKSPEVPKTWSELIEKDSRAITYNLEATYNEYQPHSTSYTPIEKSALALLKIHQLIEVGYGGNISSAEWKNKKVSKFLIHWCYDYKELIIHETFIYASPIAFHTKRQAEEFLKHPENIQLLKDYFMID